MLHINKIQAAESLHSLAIANGVTDSQMATFIFVNFYQATTHLSTEKKIHRSAITIANLTIK